MIRAVEVTRPGGDEVTRIDGPRRISSVESRAPSTAPGNSDALALPRVPAPMPTHIDRYVIVRKLGEGGMGVVYYAFDPQLERPVAIKLLRAAMREAKASKGEARLLREAQALARLSHPNVVQVFEVGEYADAVYLAMEYVAGHDLRSWLGIKDRGWREVAAVFWQAGQGLLAAHRAGVVHRDFKPDNVLVGDDGRVRVLDFGLARPPEAVPDEPLPDGTPTPGPKLTLTQAGAVIGTPAYMSPEQHLCQPTDARSDQFSFCVALWEGLYGQRPFRGANGAELRRAVFGPQPSPPPEVRLPRHLRELLARGLRIDPDDRYPTMKPLLAVLATDPARRRRRIAIGVAALGLGVLGTVASGRLAEEQRCTHGEQALIGVWDEARAEQARAAFLATGVSYAAQTWPKVQAEIDGYTRAWVAQRDEFCAATQLRGEASSELLDLRNACLDAGLRELDALVGALVTADAATVERAQQAVAGLTPLVTCTDDAFLRERVRPPIDPVVADEVARARVLLARAAARRDAGRPRESREIAIAVGRSTADVDYPPLRAETLLELGRSEEATADYALARGHLTEAYHLALAIRHDVVATDAAIVASLVYHRMGRPAEAFAWSEHARSMLQRSGERPEQRVPFLLYRSYSLTALGLHVDATQAAEEALALAEASFPAHDLRIGRMLAGVAHARWARGEVDDALALFKRSQASWRAGLGDQHPFVASSAINISTIHLLRHEVFEAQAVLRPALAIMERAFGPDHPNVADVLNNLAAVATVQGQLRQAIVAYERAIEIYARRLGPAHPNTVGLLTDLGDLHNLLGDHGAALASLGRALALRTAAKAEPPAIAATHVMIAEVLTATRRLDAAEAEYRRAQGLLERTPDPDVRQHALRGLAGLARERGAPARAEALAREALALADEQLAELVAAAKADGKPGLGSADEAARRDAQGERAPALLELGEALLAQGRFDEALIACKEALVREDRTYGPDTFRSAGPLLCLGRVYRARGQVSAAREALARAVEIQERSELAPQTQAAGRAALAEALVADEPTRAATLAARAAADYRRAGPAFAADAARLAALAGEYAAPKL